MATTTKKQHYVWRKYLAPWTNNGSLAVSMMISNIFSFKENEVVPIDDVSKIKAFNDMLYENCFNEVYANDNKILNVYCTP